MPLLRLRDLIGDQVRNGGVMLGTISDFVFDDEEWAARYLALGGFAGRTRVYLATSLLDAPSGAQHTLRARVTHRQIETSPVVEADPPISREMEMRLHDHYGWTPYWEFAPECGSEFGSSDETASRELAPDQTPGEECDQAFLRSARELTGYEVGAAGQLVGHVADVLLDVKTWSIPALLLELLPPGPDQPVRWDLDGPPRVIWPESRIESDATAAHFRELRRHA